LDRDNYHFVGRILVVPTELGGRKVGFHSGYRGQFFYQFKNEPGTDWVASYDFQEEMVNPGMEVDLFGNLAGGAIDLANRFGLNVGDQFGLREGKRIVAIGSIIYSKFDNNGRL
jgi:translation elongation factor EF-Tu-like GTPase